MKVGVSNFKDGNQLMLKIKDIYSYKHLKKLTGKVAIDYRALSSPNVAKPFHYGHLRATIQGNYLSNISARLGYDVMRINYIGNTGKQFGMLLLAIEKLNNGQIPSNIYDIYKLYIEINKMIFNCHDSKILKDKAYTTSVQLEKDFILNLKSPHISTVESLKLITDAYLDTIYKKLNIHFDITEFESDYIVPANNLLHVLVNKSLIYKHSEGYWYSDPDVNSSSKNKEIVLYTSDKTSLYLSRDLAAAINRVKNYNLDRIHYVVDIAQSLHFSHLKTLLKRMNFEWINSYTQNHPFHVPFGRIQGLSSRKGQGFFLETLLNEAEEKVLQDMSNSKTTQTHGDVDRKIVANHLTLSWLFLELLRRPRLKNIELPDFSTSRDKSGIGFQYSHARLSSMENRILSQRPELFDNYSINQNLSKLDQLIMYLSLNKLDELLLSYNEIQQQTIEELLNHLENYTNVLNRCHDEFESSYLFAYTAKLTRYINKAWEVLPVLSESDCLSAKVFICISLFIPSVPFMYIPIGTRGISRFFENFWTQTT